MDEIKPISVLKMYELQKILDTMPNIPEARKTDLGWLRRNLGIHLTTRQHPDFQKAMDILMNPRID